MTRSARVEAARSEVIAKAKALVNGGFSKIGSSPLIVAVGCTEYKALLEAVTLLSFEDSV